MKNVPMAIGLASALLLASAGNAEKIEIVWAEGVYGGNGWLPKIASDGHVGMTSLIYQIGTEDARFEYENGMFEADISSFSWNSPNSISSPTQPGDEVGHAPSIAMVNCAIPACTGGPFYMSNVIEVHQGGQDNGAALWSRTGVADGTEATSWAAAQQYDEGYNPTVAMDQNSSSPSSTTVVEVHQGGVNSSELWYHIGTLTYSASSVSVTWGPSHKIGFSGYAPTVSFSNDVVVVVAQGTSPEMWYSVGTVDYITNTINWGPATNYDTGYNPTVSVQYCSGGGVAFDCDWLLVEAHQGAKGTGSLWYRIGTITGGSTSITWTPNSAKKYTTSGCYPSVSLITNWSAGYYDVVESHSKTCGGPANITSLWGALQLE